LVSEVEPAWKVNQALDFLNLPLEVWEKVFISRIILIAREEDVNTIEGFRQFGQTRCVRTRRQIE